MNPFISSNRALIFSFAKKFVIPFSIIVIILVVLTSHVQGTKEEDNSECLKFDENNEIEKAIDCYKRVQQKYEDPFQSKEEIDTNQEMKQLREYTEARKLGPEYGLKYLESQNTLSSSLWKYKGDLLKEMNRIAEANEAYSLSDQLEGKKSPVTSDLSQITDSNNPTNERDSSKSDTTNQIQRNNNLDNSSYQEKEKSLSENDEGVYQSGNEKQNSNITQHHSSLVDIKTPNKTTLKDSDTPYEIPFKIPEFEYVSYNAYECNQKGVSFFQDGNFSESIESFNEAISIEPNYTTAWKNKALTQNKNENFKDAIYSYQHIIEFIDTEDPAVYNNLGFAYYQSGMESYQTSEKISKMQNAVDNFNEGLKLKNINKNQKEIITHNRDMANKEIPTIIDIILEFINSIFGLILGILILIFGYLLFSATYSYISSEKGKRRRK